MKVYNNVQALRNEYLRMQPNADFLLFALDSTDPYGRLHLEAYSDVHLPQDEWVDEVVEPCWCRIDSVVNSDLKYNRDPQFVYNIFDFVAEHKLYCNDLEDGEDYFDALNGDDPDRCAVRLDDYFELDKLFDLPDGTWLVVVWERSAL
jgi:hypothetical protein